MNEEDPSLALHDTPGPLFLSDVTYDEFLARPDIPVHSEWVNGRVYTMSPISKEHASVGAFLLKLLGSHAEAKDLGEVYCEPFQMKTGPDLPGRAPDVIFISKKNLPCLKRLCLEGPADLVVEIISPESRTRDQRDKFQEYQQGGVPEYWLIDPERQRAEFYLRENDGLYHAAVLDAEGRFHSRQMDGVRLKVSWLWERPLPRTLDILREWKVI
jgi:Uma2 family endonuclease